MTIIQDRRAAAGIGLCPEWCEPTPRGCDGDHWRCADYWRLKRPDDPELLLGVALSQPEYDLGPGAPAKAVLHCHGADCESEIEMLPGESRRLAAELIAADDVLEGLRA